MTYLWIPSANCLADGTVAKSGANALEADAAELAGYVREFLDR